MPTDEILVKLAQELGETTGTMKQFIATQTEANKLLATSVERLGRRTTAIEAFKTKVAALCIGASTAGGGVAHGVIKFLLGGDHAPPG